MTTVGRNALRVFTGPVNGRAAVDANIVRANDNILAASLSAHDSDPTIHVQSSDLADRPAAGVPGRLWITNDAGVYELWFDDGVSWNPVA